MLRLFVIENFGRMQTIVWELFIVVASIHRCPESSSTGTRCKHNEIRVEQHRWNALLAITVQIGHLQFIAGIPCMYHAIATTREQELSIGRECNVNWYFVGVLATCKRKKRTKTRNQCQLNQWTACRMQINNQEQKLIYLLRKVWTSPKIASTKWTIVSLVPIPKYLPSGENCMFVQSPRNFSLTLKCANGPLRNIRKS